MKKVKEKVEEEDVDVDDDGKDEKKGRFGLKSVKLHWHYPI